MVQIDGRKPREAAVMVSAERVSVLDASNLRVERYGLPMHVAALLILDAEPLFDSSGELRLAAILTHIDECTRSARRMRQVLAPRRGRPVWVVYEEFDITQHVRTRALPPPANEATLLAACAELNEVPLDRSQPLWEIWILTGMVGNRIGMLIRLHHVVADGMAALAMLAPLFDLADSAHPAPSPDLDEWREQQLFGRRVVSALRKGTRLVALLPARARQLANLLQQLRGPRLSFNQPVGPHHRLTLVRADLAAAKAVAHRHGGKVNDVVLAAVGGGTRRLLESRSELHPDLSINVSLAASIRRKQDPRSSGNRVAIRVVRVPVDEPDPIRRLEQIIAETTAQRRLPPYQPSGVLLQRWMVRVMNHQRMVNLLVSNLPGPPARLTFTGATVLEMFQVGLVQGNLAISVGVLSYAGQLTFDVVSDTDVIPDVHLFAEGMAETLRDLGAITASSSEATA
jgi:diacylglycerol O-acyltransferase / wax synthase